MIGAGTIINPIVKVVTTALILGAVYLFIVKPTLDTTEDITDRAFDESAEIQESIEDSINSTPGANDFEVEIPKAAKQAQKLGACMTKAAGNIDKVQACTKKFSP